MINLSRKLEMMASSELNDDDKLRLEEVYYPVYHGIGEVPSDTLYRLVYSNLQCALTNYFYDVVREGRHD